MDDDDLGMRRRITRRDFLDGIAIAVGAALLPGCKSKHDDAPFAPELDPAYYPPALTGLRGSHVGSFEVAHQLRDGTLSLGEADDTGERHDLVVVGAGISGLAAAHYFRARRPDATVLLLDNHDDVGGHAKRNEFAGGLVSYGGTESIEYPSLYGDVAKKLLAELGIDEAGFHHAFARADRGALGLAEATFFDKETFGADRLVVGELDPPDAAALAKTPLSEKAREELARLYRAPVDYWAHLDARGKQAVLAKLSYRAFLADHVRVGPEVLAYFQQATHSLFGVGIDAVSALDCWALEMPGFDGLLLDRTVDAPGLGRTPWLEMRHGSQSLHFPDGNASLVRLLLRKLVPAAVPGSTMADAASARTDYAKLDDRASPVRVRLSSTAVRVRNAGDEVEVTYVRGGKPYVVRGKSCVLACWHTVIPYIAPELPDAQRKALAYAVKVPLIYANAAVSSWKAMKALGVGAVSAPGGYYISARLELPYGPGAKPPNPAEPAVIKLVRTPCQPGLPARDQHRRGRAALFATPFETLERELRGLLGRMFGGGGFDPARDITAVTVNRWPHGYAYEYNSLWDDAWPPGQAPCELARRKLGRIAIANSDAGAYAYTDCAIEQAYRAITELV